MIESALRHPAIHPPVADALVTGWNSCQSSFIEASIAWLVKLLSSQIDCSLPTVQVVFSRTLYIPDPVLGWTLGL
jgi:hypothetical protein